MPELPEVETTKRGIEPFLLKQRIVDITIRQAKLRYPVSPDLQLACRNQQINKITRRAKYLIIELPVGQIIIHLGMSGHLKIVDKESPAQKHDHIDFILSNGKILRYNDPRRFGLCLFNQSSIETHKLFHKLGPEPLSCDFNESYLWQKCQNRKTPTKSIIMNNHIVVGVGNIYATESLFLSGINPAKPANQLSAKECSNLVKNIKSVLSHAISMGGTSLKDFYQSNGKPGYFAQSLQVYGRQEQSCFNCDTTIKVMTITGRNSAFCPSCQPLTPI